MNKVTKIMASVVALGAIAVPALAVSPAFASERPAASVSAGPTTTAPATSTDDGGKRAHRGQRLLRRAAVNKVAAQLGITPDALRAAIKDARANHKPAQPITDQKARRQYWLSQVADELHVTPEKLLSAVKAARQEIRSELLGN